MDHYDNQIVQPSMLWRDKVHLLDAVISGKIEMVQFILSQNPASLNEVGFAFKDGKNCEVKSNAIGIACMFKKQKMLKHLIEIMPPEALEFPATIKEYVGDKQFDKITPHVLLVMDLDNLK